MTQNKTNISLPPATSRRLTIKRMSKKHGSERPAIAGTPRLRKPGWRGNPPNR